MRRRHGQSRSRVQGLNAGKKKKGWLSENPGKRGETGVQQGGLGVMGKDNWGGDTRG